MDYELKNAPKSNDTILSIYNLDIEKADSSDGLYDVRKEFFLTEHLHIFGIFLIEYLMC